MPAIINQALYQVLEQKVARSIQFQQQKKDVYFALKQAADDLNLPIAQKNLILKTVKDKLTYNPDVDYIYIAPRAQDYEMFFADHFSLNANILQKILKIGFKSVLI